MTFACLHMHFPHKHTHTHINSHEKWLNSLFIFLNEAVAIGCVTFSQSWQVCRKHNQWESVFILLSVIDRSFQSIYIRTWSLSRVTSTFADRWTVLAKFSAAGVTVFFLLLLSLSHLSQLPQRHVSNQVKCKTMQVHVVFMNVAFDFLSLTVSLTIVYL